MFLAGWYPGLASGERLGSKVLSGRSIDAALLPLLSTRGVVSSRGTSTVLAAHMVLSSSLPSA